MKPKKNDKPGENVYSRKLRNAMAEDGFPEGDFEAFMKLKALGDEKRCKTMIVAPEVNGLVATTAVSKGEPLIEFNGSMHFMDEEKMSDKVHDPSLFYKSVVYA